VNDNSYNIEADLVRLTWLRDRAANIAGILLIVLGILFLVDQWLGIHIAQYLWPFVIIVPGVALLVHALSLPDAAGQGFAIAGSLVTMLGLVLLAQSLSGLWATWAYAWALVAPTSVGIGMILHSWVRGTPAASVVGWGLVKIGLGLFFGFAVFFEGLFNISGMGIGRWLLPLGLVALGLYTMWKTIRSR